MKQNKGARLLGLTNGVQAKVRRPNDTHLVGYAVDINSNRLPGAREERKKIVLGMDLDTAFEQFANQIVDDYLTENKLNDSYQEMPENPFTTAYAAIKNKEDLCNLDWAKSTKDRSVSYMENQIIPRLDAMGKYLSEKDLLDITNELTQQTKSSKKGYKEEKQAKKTVMGNLYRTNVLLKNLRKNTTFPLPEGLFYIENDKLPQREQPKHIPVPVRLKMAQVLLRLATTNVLAQGVALMLFCGLRTSEACAVVIGDILVAEDYAVVPVTGQIKGDERIKELKTPAAYRIAVGGDAMATMVKKRVEALLEQGISIDEIQKTPLVGSLVGDCQPDWIDPGELSAFGKHLLLDCGYEAATLAEMEILMKVEQDRDVDGEVLSDVTAYIMRRDFIGRCCNCCGMTSADVDYLVGHKRKDSAFDGFVDEKVQKDVARKINRYQFDFQGLPDTGFVDLEGSQHYWLTPVDYDRVVDLSLLANEPNDAIQVIFNGEVVSLKALMGAMDSPEKRKCRPIFGAQYEAEFYKEIKAEADELEGYYGKD